MVEELFTYWNLDEADEYLEELEEALIVRAMAADTIHTHHAVHTHPFTRRQTLAPALRFE